MQPQFDPASRDHLRQSWPTWPNGTRCHVQAWRSQGWPMRKQMVAVVVMLLRPRCNMLQLLVANLVFKPALNLGPLCWIPRVELNYAKRIHHAILKLWSENGFASFRMAHGRRMPLIFFLGQTVWMGSCSYLLASLLLGFWGGTR